MPTVARWILIACLAVLPTVALGVNLEEQIVDDKMPGWSLRGKAADSWVIKDGVLHCTGGGKNWGEWFGTDQDYTDVIVEFEYKLPKEGNSGCYLRTPTEGLVSAIGFEVQLLDDDAPKYSKLVPSQFTGSVYKIVAPARRAIKPAGEWNHMRIKADRDHLVVVVNGETVVDANGQEYPEILTRNARGPIGFQNHHTAAWFRNIRVADLARDRAERSQWWRDAKFGMFIHWGVYSVLGQGEWNMKVSRIPAAEYEKLPPQFNPAGFDAAEWVALAKRAGQKYMVFTSKHHDGFAMYDSKVSKYDITDATPFKRDPIKELAEACADQGVRFGIYHSILDWHHPDYEPIPDWDPARAGTTPDFDKYIEYMTAQARELCTSYGPLACWWWDGPWGHENPVGRGRFAAVNAMIRQLQPGILINNRAAIPEDFDTPEQYIPPTGITNPDGTPTLWENCITLTTGHGSHPPTAWWGYDKHETEYKPTEYCIRMLVDVVSKGGNLLLNVGPTPEGRIQQAEVDALEAMGRWLEVNGEAIYGTTASPFSHLPFFGRATVKGHTLYVHVFGWPSDRRIVLPGLTNKVVSAKLLGSAAGLPLTASRRNDSVLIELPEAAPDPVASVIAVQLDGTPKVEPFTIRPQADGTIRLMATVAEIQSQHGQRARFDAAGDRVYVGNWTNNKDVVCWQFNVDKPGSYSLVLDYAAAEAAAGATFETAIVADAGKPTTQPAETSPVRMFEQLPASAKLAGTVTATAGPNHFEEHRIGEVELSAGTNRLLIRPIKLPAKDSLMNLSGATLVPTE